MVEIVTADQARRQVLHYQQQTVERELRNVEQAIIAACRVGEEYIRLESDFWKRYNNVHYKEAVAKLEELGYQVLRPYEICRGTVIKWEVDSK